MQWEWQDHLYGMTISSHKRRYCKGAHGADSDCCTPSQNASGHRNHSINSLPIPSQLRLYFRHSNDRSFGNRCVQCQLVGYRCFGLPKTIKKWSPLIRTCNGETILWNCPMLASVHRNTHHRLYTIPQYLVRVVAVALPISDRGQFCLKRMAHRWQPEQWPRCTMCATNLNIYRNSTWLLIPINCSI